MSDFGSKLNKAFLGEEEYAAITTGSSSSNEHATVGDYMEFSESNEHLIHSQLPSEGILVLRGFVVYHFSPGFVTNNFSPSIPAVWTRLPDCRRDRSYFETAFVPSRREIVAISTFNLLASGTVEKFKFDYCKWITISPLPRKLRSVSSCVDESLYPNEVLYVIGGIDVTSQEVSDYIYFLHNAQNSDDQDSWVPCGKLVSPRFRHASIIYQGLVWSVGGIVRPTGILPPGVNEEYSSSVELWDPVTQSSRPFVPLRQCRAIDCVLLEVSGVLFVVGGDVGQAVESLEGDREALAVYTIDRFDLSSQLWVPVTQFPSPRRGFSATAFGESIYIFGGRSGNEDLYSWDAYHIRSGLWLSSTTHPAELQMPPECNSLYGSAVAYSLRR